MKTARGKFAAVIAAVAIFFLVLLDVPLLSAATAATPSTTSATVFPQNLQLYDSGPNVFSLQKFLNGQGFVVAQTGPGSPGSETTFFGLRTYRALIRYQQAHGLPATGFFGPLTRAAIFQLTSSSARLNIPAAPTPLAATSSTSIPVPEPRALPAGYTPGFGGGDAPNPTCALAAASGSIIVGSSTSLSWNSTNAVSASLSEIGAVNTTDSQSVSPTSNTTYTLTVSNGAGESAACSTTVFATDMTPPSISVTAPATNATVSGSSVTLTASTSDVFATIESVQFEVDGTDIGAPITSTPYTTTWNSAGVADGSHTLYAVANDSAGLYATSSITLTTHNGGTIYYVSPAGNDSNNGTSPSTPWQTGTKVNDGSYDPGDFVLFQGGQSFTGCLSFSGSNVLSTSTTGTPFTIGSYGSGNFTLTANCSGTQASAINLSGVDNVALDDATLVGNSGGAEYGVWIHNTTSTETGNVTVENSNISGFYTTSTSDYGAEIFITGYPGTGGLTNIDILDDTLHGSSPSSPDDNGISGYGNGKNITNVLYQGNTVYDIGGKANGYGGSEGNGILANGVNGGIIQDNLVHDTGANTNTCGGPVGIMAYNANNVTVQYNEVYNVTPTTYSAGCDWDGFDLDGSVTNSVMQYNYSHNNWGAGYLLYGSGTWGPNTVRYNISENDDQMGSAGFGGITYSIESTGYTTYVYNNTILNNRTYTGSQYGSTNAVGPGIAIETAKSFSGVLANNIIVTHNRSDGTFIPVDAPKSGFSPTVQLFNNDYYSLTGATANFYWGSTIYSSLASFQSGTGEDTNSTTTEPQLGTVSGAGTCGNVLGPQPCPSAYQLLSFSPLVDAGADLTASTYSLSVGSRDYYGTAIPNGAGSGYNIGAYGATPTPDTTPPSVSLTAPAANSTVSGTTTLTATASDNIAVARVQFKVDGTNVGSAVTTAPYTTAWDSSSVSDGSHTLSAVAEDGSGNFATSSITVTDSNSLPVISSISTGTPGTTNATITWTTSRGASSQIAYGASASYGATTTLDSTLVTSHSVNLTGLTPSTTYHFEVLSSDAGGRLATSSDQTLTTSAPSYSGPGDVVSGAVAWWGLRGYNAAYSGNAANICLPNDTLCDNATISYGNLVIPSDLGSCNNTTTICTVKTLYDQSGANSCGGVPCNITNASTSTRPTLKLNCQGSFACAQASGSASLTNATGFTQAQPFTMSFVSERNGGNYYASQIFINGTNGTCAVDLNYANPSTVNMYAGGASLAATESDSKLNALQAVFNGSSSVFWVNATSTFGSPGTRCFGDGSFFLMSSLTGYFLEGGIWGSAFSTTTASSVNSNQHSYWGF